MTEFNRELLSDNSTSDSVSSLESELTNSPAVTKQCPFHSYPATVTALANPTLDSRAFPRPNHASVLSSTQLEITSLEYCYSFELA